MPGYRDPPLHSRFKPGQSGNPAGGPRGPRRKSVSRPSTYLDEQVKCKIGGKPFKGSRREAVVLVATQWAIKKPVKGSQARTATDQEKLPKPDLGLQQLLLKLMEQEEEKERLFQRDDPFYLIQAWPSSPDCVTCIEDAVDVAGFGVKVYRDQKSARVLLGDWVIEDGLANLGDRRLTREVQKEVLAATRFPKKIDWPEWWELDLRERGKGWRATQPVTIKEPGVVRMSLADYMEWKRERDLRQAEYDYERHKYPRMDRLDQELGGKPFERPGRPGRIGRINPGGHVEE